MLRTHRLPIVLSGLAWGIATALCPATSEPRSSPTVPPELKVVTFNVQFLPGVASAYNKRRDPEYRARELAARLAGYDIIGLNEVFDARHRQILLDGLRRRLGEEFHCVRPPRSARSEFGIGSGLALVTRLPVLAQHSLRYGNDSSVWKYGLMADGFAAKGALHARLGPAGRAFDVFLTHMESQDEAVRNAQYPLFADFVRRYADPARPALILGDFNTPGTPGDPPKGTPYGRLLECLRRARRGLPLEDLGRTLGGAAGTDDPDLADGGKRIDYIFLSDPGADRPAPRLRAAEVRVNRFADGHVTTLSDHAAVEARLCWEMP